jgi:isopentenyl-diphosphate delta-isomerase
MAREEVVSNASEELILVDELDREIGAKPKSECHAGNGILHRAFSIFIFNDSAELLLQQRSAEKPLWPGYWSNACCSHPRLGETMETAVSRRLVQELGFECPLEYLYKFKYHAQYGAVGAEHEYCWVYHGRYNGVVDANINEIAAWRFVGLEALGAELEAQPERFTPWFKMEWTHIKNNFLDDILERAPLNGQ